jgi:hAT family C-terminal dimerisation region
MKTKNIFDTLPAICAPKTTDLHDELDSYLGTDPEHTADVLLWWVERKHIYPSLSRMALDYLSIPGMSFTSLMLILVLIYICSYLR